MTGSAKTVTAIEVLQGIEKTNKATNGNTQPAKNEKEQYQSSQILNEAIEALNTLERAIDAQNDQTYTVNVEEAQYKTLIAPTSELIKTLEEINKSIKEDFKIFIEMNTEASDALTAATEGIKTRNAELKRLNQQDAELKSLIEKNINVNTQLFGILIEVNKVTKALTIEMQRLNDGKIGLQPLRKVIGKMTTTVQFTLNARQDVQNAHYEYQQAQIKNGQ